MSKCTRPSQIGKGSLWRSYVPGGAAGVAYPCPGNTVLYVPPALGSPEGTAALHFSYWPWVSYSAAVNNQWLFSGLWIYMLNIKQGARKDERPPAFRGPLWGILVHNGCPRRRWRKIPYATCDYGKYRTRSRKSCRPVSHSSWSKSYSEHDAHSNIPQALPEMSYPPSKQPTSHPWIIAKVLLIPCLYLSIVIGSLIYGRTARKDHSSFVWWRKFYSTVFSTVELWGRRYGTGGALPSLQYRPASWAGETGRLCSITCQIDCINEFIIISNTNRDDNYYLITIFTPSFYYFHIYLNYFA